jgi:hypothetical protein
VRQPGDRVQLNFACQVAKTPSGRSSVMTLFNATRPYILADGDDAVDNDAGPGAFPCDLGEELPYATEPSAISGLCWM